MAEHICDVCNRDLSTLPEQGCEDCGQEYDPMAPDFNQELSFEDAHVDPYETLPDIMEVVHESLVHMESNQYEESDE